MLAGEHKTAKWKKAAPVVYQCGYHLVWTPKHRYRILTGEIKEYVEKKIRALCGWKRVERVEMTIMPDPIHMAVIIPPESAGIRVMGILKGKAATAVFQQAKCLRTKPYRGNHFWGRGYCVTTVGIDEEKMRRYVKYQEDAERLDEDHELQEGLIVEANIQAAASGAGC
ncbi:MAG: IS200/IS605 family transposase [Treponematales bacterium]